MKKGLSNKGIITFTLLLSAFFLASSCSPTRKAMKEPIREQGAGYIFGIMKKNELQYDWLSAKFNVRMEVDGKDNSMNGQMRIRRDSAIWASFAPALGIEVARIMVTRDSVKLLNRISDTYLKTDFSFINDNLNSGFDFDMLLGLIIGNDFSFYETDKFREDIDNGIYRLSTIGRGKLKKFIRSTSEQEKLLTQSIWVNPENGKIQEVHVKETGKDNKKLKVQYSGFEQIGSQLFPMMVKFDIEAERHIKVEVQFSKLKINESLSMPFSIPADYKQMEQKP